MEQTHPLVQNRRSLFKKILQIVSVSALFSLSSLRRARAKEEPQRAYFIKKALEMRDLAIETGDQAYGAIVVKNGKIVGQGPSRVIVNQDPTAHGEVEAIRDACRNLKSNDLSGCELYSSARPCQMCETASYWANISQVYYGSSIQEGGRPRYSSC